MLIRINISEFRDIADDKDFFTKLICEESISCLPASVSKCIRMFHTLMFFFSRTI